MIVHQCKHCLYKSSHADHVVEHEREVHEKSKRSKLETNSSTDLRIYIQNATCDPLSETRDPLDTIKTESNADGETEGISMAIGEIKEEVLDQEADLESVQLKVKSFQCEVCPYKAPNRYKLARHHKSVHAKLRDFTCNDCDFTSSQKGHLDVHRRTVHEGIKLEKNLPCDLCDKLFETKSDIVRHIKRTHDSTKDYTCEECGYATAHRDNFQRHRRAVHLKIREHQCDQCERAFSDRRDLKVHIMSIHDKVRPFKCDACDYRATKKSMLNKHLQKGHMKKELKEEERMQSKMETKTENPHERRQQMFNCHLCPYKSKKRDRMSRHIKRTHDNTKDYTCEECGYATAHRDNFQRHRRSVHLKIRNHQCDQCGRAFSDRRDLKVHIMAIHYEVKPFKCDTCDYRSANKSMVKKHFEKVHTNGETTHKELKEETRVPKKEMKTENPKCEKRQQILNCQLCPYKSKRRDSMNRHFKAIHTNIRDFQCDICGRGFAQKAHVDSHRRTVHEGIRDHKCDLCERAFDTRSNLRKHKKRVHFKIRDHMCEECGFATCDKKSFTGHMARKHGRAMEHICDECGFETAWEEDLLKHQMRHHMKRDLELDDHSTPSEEIYHAEPEDSGKLVCKWCDYTGETSANVTQHVNMVHLNSNLNMLASLGTQVSYGVHDSAEDKTDGNDDIFTDEKDLARHKTLEMYAVSNRGQVDQDVDREHDVIEGSTFEGETTFPEERAMDVAIKSTTTRDQTVTCDICNLEFSDERTVKRHQIFDKELCIYAASKNRQTNQLDVRQDLVDIDGPPAEEVEQRITTSEESRVEAFNKIKLTEQTKDGKCSRCHLEFSDEQILERHKIFDRDLCNYASSKINMS